jgi:ABC-type amino acid transport substrate-binding protein
VDAVSKIVDDMHKDGTLTTLSTKWYGVDLTMKK